MKILTTVWSSRDGVYFPAPDFALIHMNDPSWLLERRLRMEAIITGDDTFWSMEYHTTSFCYAEYIQWTDEVEELLGQDDNHDHIMDGYPLFLPDDFKVDESKALEISLPSVVLYQDRFHFNAHHSEGGGRVESRGIPWKELMEKYSEHQG